MIERLELKNFTAFKSLELDLSSKINVIIGENGTGKTHLLKAAYGLCSGNATVSPFLTEPDAAIEAALTSKLVGLFLPLDRDLGNLQRRGTTEPAEMKASFIFEKSIALSFELGSTSVALNANDAYTRYSWEPVLIPTKEVLSFMQGFVSLFDRREVSFDESYRDICEKLDLPRVRQNGLREESSLLLNKIEHICGGRFAFHGGGMVNFETQDGEYSANAVAEGFRKLGMLARLIETEAIVPGATGPLFWDEPETNLNPKLMKILAEILLELGRSNHQVILATHEYTLLKWFDLLRDKDIKDQVRFHALYRDPDSKEIMVHSTDDYLALEPNAIADTFTDLTLAQISAQRGTLQNA